MQGGSDVEESTKDKWEIPREKLSINKLVGKGEYGIVFEATLLTVDGGTLKVAAKKPKEDNETLLSELNVLKKVTPHPNIVHFIGACTSRNGPPYLLTEFMDGGTLLSYLRGQRRHVSQTKVDYSVITDKELLTLAMDVAQGLNHLVAEGLVHGDLAARNVLLTRDRVAKIGDFGLSLSDGNTSKKRVPARWMSPELLERRACSTSQSDVWAFGVLLWEMFTLGGSPYPGLSAQRLMKYISSGQRLEKPISCCDEVYDVMQSCWRWEPSERPVFAHILESLQTLLVSRQVNPQNISANKLDALYPYLEMDNCSANLDSDSQDSWL